MKRNEAMERLYSHLSTVAIALAGEGQEGMTPEEVKESIANSATSESLEYQLIDHMLTINDMTGEEKVASFTPMLGHQTGAKMGFVSAAIRIWMTEFQWLLARRGKLVILDRETSQEIKPTPLKEIAYALELGAYKFEGDS